MRLVLILIAGLAAAQDNVQFSADSRLVLVDVDVTERGTGAVRELLGPQDFEIEVNGRRQQIREFEFETTPLDVVFLFFGKTGVGPASDIQRFGRTLELLCR